MKKQNKVPTFIYHYFLDEAGDPSFYGKGKTIIVGQQGVSLCYILGMVKFEGDLNTLRNEVVRLQRYIESASYFKGIGSVEKKKKHQGYYFHATDDMPEIRMLFFDFIKSLDCSFEAVVATKIPDLYVKKHNASPREFYADLLSHLLHDKLETDCKMVLNIAKRGTSTRHDNLDLSLHKAIAKFTRQYPDSIVNSQVVFNVQDQLTEPLLNVADYLCWSIQRVFEKGETRFYDHMQDKIKLVVDLYDNEGMESGENKYDRNNPLTAENKKSPLST